MIRYVLSHVGRFLRETLVPAADPLPVSVSGARYVVPLNGTVHHVRRDRTCDCGGTPQSPCPAVSLVREYLVRGGPRPPGRPEATWPEVWAAIPACCPVCDCPTVADRQLDSARGPGWRCTFDPLHFWQVRLRPLRRCLAARSPHHPWYEHPPAERQAWLEAHSHPPRCIVNQPQEVTA
jgi:hypothetical protein